MMQRQAQSLSSVGEDKIQVFVSPASINFCSDDTSSHQVAITVFNPYDFALRYKVLCTAPKKYKVVASEGVIKARYCADVIIRHKDICPRYENVKDKFRIQVTKPGEKTVIGKKDVVAVLLPTADRTQAAEEAFESVTQQQERLQSPGTGSNRPFTSIETSKPSWVVIVATVVCIAFLMLPSKVSEDSSIPTYLCVSDTKKLVAAYILGLVTMYLFQS